MTALISLAAQHAPGEGAKDSLGCRFFVLDGSPVDAAYYGAFARLRGVLPQGLWVGGLRDLPAIVADVAGEVIRRQKLEEAQTSSIYLVVFGLQRFRDLRNEEDGFGFSRPNDEYPGVVE